MNLTTKTLLPVTVYGTPSGNYDGTTPDFVGNVIPGASYYNGQGSVQTAIITTTNFVGVITLQATLGSIYEQSAWFDVASYGNSEVATSGTTSINLIGNFVWVRAAVTNFTDGTVNSATLVY